jgi:hypothetical protein
MQNGVDINFEEKRGEINPRKYGQHPNSLVSLRPFSGRKYYLRKCRTPPSLQNILQTEFSNMIKHRFRDGGIYISK